MSEDKQVKPKKIEEPVVFKGKFIYAVGRRKTSSATVRLYKNGKGNILVNGQKHTKYFAQDKVVIMQQPLKLVSLNRDFDVSINVSGGGIKSQAEAIRHGIARALILFDEKLRDQMKAKDMLRRDDRKKERKKPGLKKARRAPQWSKR
jgi:small subunit ribosomal protein S9